MIVNLGTPDEANPQNVKEFLASFLSDQRAIKMPRLLWQAILHGMIMQVRPKKSAALYQKYGPKMGLLSSSRIHQGTGSHDLRSIIRSTSRICDVV